MFEAYLEVTNGPDLGKQYPLPADPGAIVRIGRTAIGHPLPDVAIPADRMRVSRKHAEIVYLEGVYYVRRPGEATNPTEVNGQPLEKGQLRQLEPGDCIKLPEEFAYVFQRVAKRSQDTVVLADDQAEGEMPDVESSLDASGTVFAISPEERLRVLLEIVQNLGRALALDEVLPQVLNSLFNIFRQADRAIIVLKTDEGQLIPRWSKTRGMMKEEYRISRMVVRQVMEQKRALLFKDGDIPDATQSVMDLRLRSLMCVPLLGSDGHPLGVIQMDTRDARKKFEKKDLELLVSVAAPAGIAIDNAQLHERILQRTKIEKELENDLALALEVQRSLLPSEEPKLSGYRFVPFYEAAKVIGGDYYDYISLPDGRTAVLVADVVGKGVAAAMLMARMSAEAKYCLATATDAAAAMAKLNDRIVSLRLDRFITVIMIVLDPVRHEATIVNAGHMAPLWKHADGTVSEPGSDRAGIPIGIVEGFGYEQSTIRLEPGDALILWTDGIDTAMNVQGAQYTIERLRQRVHALTADIDQVAREIIDDVRRHVGDAPQTDDMCLLCLRREQ
jgi:serine phosphatase RsbU (regulator of sigma subunit)